MDERTAGIPVSIYQEGSVEMLGVCEDDDSYADCAEEEFLRELREGLVEI